MLPNEIKEGMKVRLVRLDPDLSYPAWRYWAPYLLKTATVVPDQGPWVDNVLIEFEDGIDFPASPNEIEPVEEES